MTAGLENDVSWDRSDPGVSAERAELSGRKVTPVADQINSPF